MAQHDYVISNDDGASVRSDINDMAAAIKSNNSDASAAPSSPVQGMRWCKTVDATHQEVYEYDGANWVLLYVINPTTHLVDKVAVSAHKNGTDQTGVTSATDIKVTFGTEDWDIGGHFASSTWTPPAGKYRISASIRFTSANAVDNEVLSITIYKNGSAHRLNTLKRNGSGSQTTHITATVIANGTDTFEIYALKGSAGDGTIDGTSSVTFFQAEAI